MAITSAGDSLLSRIPPLPPLLFLSTHLFEYSYLTKYLGANYQRTNMWHIFLLIISSKCWNPPKKRHLKVHKFTFTDKAFQRFEIRNSKFISNRITNITENNEEDDEPLIDFTGRLRLRWQFICVFKITSLSLKGIRSTTYWPCGIWRCIHFCTSSPRTRASSTSSASRS